LSVKIYCAFKNPSCKYAKNRSPEGAECTYEGLCKYQVIDDGGLKKKREA